MAKTVSGSVNGSTLTVTGGGYVAGERVTFNLEFAATDNKRRFNETRSVVADGSGNISVTVTLAQTSGTLTARALSGTSVAASSSGISC